MHRRTVMTQRHGGFGRIKIARRRILNMFHARQIWTIISTIAAMLTIMALNLYSQPLAAQTIVTLQDDYSISFLRGQFDDKKHQGEIFDVELFERGERFATADRLLLLSDRPLQGSILLFVNSRLTISDSRLKTLHPQLRRCAGATYSLAILQICPR